ncbi:hypothetical protein [uncultured Corynebacterium sp.]|uniref:hypothetical protein n=1 Tax=uncultured Corynebacterium sp. TaxID=159447 RepID=UPI0025D0E760|nr:hypothetical protein [uncultured Corynebacterium sp.]
MTNETNSRTATSSKAKKPKKPAGAFDVRNIIGALLGIYGLVLLLAAFFLDPGMNPDTGMPKDASYNTWTGLAMVATAAVFFLWAKFNPVVVPVEAGEGGEGATTETAAAAEPSKEA